MKKSNGNGDGKALANDVRKGISRNGMTIAEVATLINVAEPTLRTWLHRGHFPRPVIARIANLLGWDHSPDDLAKKYGISWSQSRGLINDDEESVSLEQVLEFQDLLSERINDNFVSENTKGLCRCFDAMRHGDLSVFSSLSVLPMEFERERWEPFGRAVADGVGNGGVCLYLTPDENIIGRFTDATKWNDHKMIMAHEFRAHLQEFRTNVEQYLVFEGRCKEKQAKECVQERVIHQTYKESPFLSPGFAIGMFQTQGRAGNVLRRMTIRVPTDLGGVLFIPEVKREVFTWRFCKFIRETIKVLSQQPEVEKESLKKVESMLRLEFLPG